MRIKGLYVIRSGGAALPTIDLERRAEENDDEGMPTMEVRFSPFGEWYEINSWYEGRFLERTKRGAFKRTIGLQQRADGRSNVKTLFNHGSDFHIGDKVLGVPSSLRERDDSPEMLVPLFDTSYNRDLIPGLREGAYGSSFMFEVIRDSWNHEPDESDWNPERLPERTIEEVRLLEAGPVTWPANPAATAGLRSGCGTDGWLERMATRDADRFERMVSSFKTFRKGLEVAPHTPAPGDEPDRHVARSKSARERALFIMSLRG